MPICLCDGEAYTIENKTEAINRSELFRFFLDGHRQDIILVINEDGQYDGAITYRSLINGLDTLDIVTYEKLVAGEENFWKKAIEYFRADKEKVIPVFNHEMELQYLARWDGELTDLWNKLRELQMYLDCETWKSLRNHEDHIHIRGMNDVLFFLREWLSDMGTQVSVEGPEWGLFGIKEKAAKGTLVEPANYNWLNELYLEYTELFDFDLRRLEELLRETAPFEPGKEKIIFYLPAYPFWVENIGPLIFYYLNQGKNKECIVAFPDGKKFTEYGQTGIRRVAGLIEKIEAAGGKCVNRAKCEELYGQEYEVCYLCSEYSGGIPSALRKASRYVVSLQTSAIYTHVYVYAERFEEIFSGQAKEEMNYLVVTDYTADWLCGLKKDWSEKLLRFGYPKLDTMYHAFKQEPYLPPEWKKKAEGKTVFLITVSVIEQSWLEALFGRGENNLVIWRMHPNIATDVRERERINEISEKYPVIVDDTENYYAAFYLSDASIATPAASPTVNYLCTGKPLCIYDANERRKPIEYRDEIWYKSAYIAKDDRDVFAFVEKVEQGQYKETEEMAANRSRVMNNFDGRVCERIYNYFSNESGLENGSRMKGMVSIGKRD